jgi:hypothetical protein
MVEIDQRAVGPQGLAQLLPSHDLPGSLNKQGQNLEGLLLKPDACPAPEEFSCAQVGRKGSEAHSLNRPAGDWHPRAPSSDLQSLARGKALGSGPQMTEK